MGGFGDRPEMKRSPLDQRLEATRRRLQALRKRAAASPEDRALLQEALTELDAALQEREARTEAILNTVVDGIITIDEQGMAKTAARKIEVERS